MIRIKINCPSCNEILELVIEGDKINSVNLICSSIPVRISADILKQHGIEIG